MNGPVLPNGGGGTFISWRKGEVLRGHDRILLPRWGSSLWAAARTHPDFGDSRETPAKGTWSEGNRLIFLLNII